MRRASWRSSVVSPLGGLRRHEDEEGQALVEYALILALIAVFAIGALQALGTSVSDSLNYIASQIGGVVP